MNPVHYSSKTAEWGTPPEIIERVRGAIRPGVLVLDVCAQAHNAKLPHYLSENSLARDWAALASQIDSPGPQYCWMNPPYGRPIPPFVEKAAKTADDGVGVVALLPSRTDTRWWHSFVEPVRLGRWPGEVVFVKGRIVFLGPDGQPVKDKHGKPMPAPFPSVLVRWDPR